MGARKLGKQVLWGVTFLFAGIMFTKLLYGEVRGIQVIVLSQVHLPLQNSIILHLWCSSFPILVERRWKMHLIMLQLEFPQLPRCLKEYNDF